MTEQLPIEKTDAQLDAEATEQMISVFAERMAANGYKQEIAQDDFCGVLRCLAIAERGQRCAMLTGRAGCGKTYAMKTAHPEARTIRMNSDDDLMLIHGRVSEFCAVNQLILLDDVGSERMANEFGTKIDRFSDILLDWYDGGRKSRLLLTTNLTGVQMRDRYGERVLSRVLAVCEVYKMIGRDHRENETCAQSQNPEVNKVIKKFSNLVRDWGRHNVYPMRFIEVESYPFKGPRDVRAIIDGVMHIMGGHPGCTVDPDAPITPIADTFKRLAAGFKA